MGGDITVPGPAKIRYLIRRYGDIGPNITQARALYEAMLPTAQMLVARSENVEALARGRGRTEGVNSHMIQLILRAAANAVNCSIDESYSRVNTWQQHAALAIRHITRIFSIPGQRRRMRWRRSEEDYDRFLDMVADQFGVFD